MIVVLHGFLLGIVSIYSNVHDLTDWLPDFAVGIAYAAGLMPDTVREVLLPPYISGIVGIILLCFLIRLVQRKKLAFEWMSALAAVYVGMMIIICAQNIRPHQWDNLGNIQITQTINRLQEMEPDQEVWLLHSWGNENIDTLQFYLPKQRIHVIPEEEFDLFALDERDLIVTYRDDERDEALGMLYRMVERSWHLNLHYNP